MIGQRRCHSRARRLEAVAEFVGASQQILAFEQIEHGQRRGAGERIAGERSAESAGAGSIHDFGAAGDRSQRQSAAQRFRGDDKIRLDAVALAGKQRAGAAETRLHFVGNKEDAVLVAEIDQHLEVIRRRRDESAFTQNWLGDHGSDFFVCHHALERVFEMTRAVKIARGIFHVIGAAIAVGERDAIHLAGKRRESGLVRMRLAGEGQRHHGAAVEGVFEGDDAGALGVGAGDLDRVLDRLGAAVDEDSFLRETCPA